MSEHTKTPVLSVVGYVDKIIYSQNHWQGKVYNTQTVVLTYDDRYEYNGKPQGKINHIAVDFSDNIWNKLTPPTRGDLVQIDYKIQCNLGKDKNGNGKYYTNLRGMGLGIFNQSPVATLVTPPVVPGELSKVPEYVEDDDLPF